MPFRTIRGVKRVEIVKVVQIVPPELLQTGVIPSDRREIMFLVEQTEAFRTEKARPATGRFYPFSLWNAPRRNLPPPGPGSG